MLSLTLQPSVFPSLKYINAVQVIRNGAFTVSFGDIRDAKKAFDSVPYLIPGARAIYTSPKTLAADLNQDPVVVSDFQGQAIIKVCYYDPYKPAQPIINEIRRLLAQCGDVKALHALEPLDPAHNFREFRVEFYNTDAVAVAKDLLYGHFDGVSFIFFFHVIASTDFATVRHERHHLHSRCLQSCCPSQWPQAKRACIHLADPQRHWTFNCAC